MPPWPLCDKNFKKCKTFEDFQKLTESVVNALDSIRHVPRYGTRQLGARQLGADAVRVDSEVICQASKKAQRTQRKRRFGSL